MVIVLDPLLSLALTLGRAVTLRSYRHWQFFHYLRFLRIQHLLLNDLLAIDGDPEVLPGDRLESRGLVVLRHVINLLVRDLCHVVQELVLACMRDSQVLPMARL